MEEEESKDLDPDLDPVRSPEVRKRDEQMAEQLLERLMAMSWWGRHRVCEALMQNEPHMVVATACEKIGVSGVLESMAGYCDRVRETITYTGKPEEADVYQWRESLLRAFQKAIDGPPHPA